MHNQSAKRLESSYVGPDLGPNCLQRLSTDDKVAASKERFKLGGNRGMTIPSDTGARCICVKSHAQLSNKE